tara:strand:- start:175 stop:594 length:420 start_codon:yes stop_codon:yes gene_type:complete
MDKSLLKNNNQNDIPKEKPEEQNIFNEPHIYEWFMMFILTFLWVLGTHYTFLIGNRLFPFFLRDLRNKNMLNLWKLIIYKILLFSLFAYLFETTIVSKIVNIFMDKFLILTDTKIHYLAASLGITLGLFSGLRLKMIIK